MRKRYYAERHGLHGHRLELDETVRLFASIVGEASERDLLQKWFGYDCVDEGFVPGRAGPDIDGFVYRKTRRVDVWPIAAKSADWDEAALFTAVEFIHDHVSAAVDGRQHTWQNCGYHATSFDDSEGQRQFREEVNSILGDYAAGFELTEYGEVIRAAPEEMTGLLDQPVDPTAGADVLARVTEAVRKFRRRTATEGDRKDAVRDLADVVELLTDRAQDVLATADERDLFHLANKFGLRHANKEQKTAYDKAIWYDWMFYYYLSAIQAFTRTLGRRMATSLRAGPHLPEIAVAQRVRHARWGEGAVVNTKQTRSDLEVTIAFRDPSVGRKTLLASLAGLELID
jgi:PcrA/UvrD tudor domain